MHSVWQIQEAKNKFSAVVNKARSEGPQIVTRHGQEVAVVISVEAFRQMQQPREDLVTFFRTSPLSQVELDLGRDASLAREIKL